MEIKSVNFREHHFDSRRHADMQKLFGTSVCYFNKENSVKLNLLGENMSVIPFEEVNDDDVIYELNTAQFYALEDRSWIKNKNILLSNLCEPWIIGLPFDQQIEYQPDVFEDITLLDYATEAKSFTVVSDNADTRLKDRYPYIKWVHANIWHKEAFDSFNTDPPRPIEQDWIKGIDMHEFIEKYTHNNKKHDFTCLVGKIKPHRLDFWFQCVSTSGDLVHNNIIGSWDKHIINPKYESVPDHTQDRVIQPQWVKDSKIWISLETFREITDPIFPITQITEKTFKPIRYGMPFLINGSKQLFKLLEQLGYDNYTSVFGDYVDVDYRITNKNIIEIIKNIDNYDWSLIKEIAHSNIAVMQSWNNKRFIELHREAIYE